MPSHHPVGALLAATLLLSSATAQEPRPAIQAAWQDFQGELPGPWLVRWHGATGTPVEIYGRGYDLNDWRGNSEAEARRHAELELQRWTDLLGIGTSVFTETIGARMGRTWSFTFGQTFRGVPVIGGRADLRVHMRGRVCYLGSTAVPVPENFDTTPAIGEDTAIAIAWQDRGIVPTNVPQPGQPRQPRLVIWTDHGSPAIASVHLAWEIPISAVDATGDGPIGRVYVDAKAGTALAYRNDKHECGLPNCAFNARPLAAAKTLPHDAAPGPKSPAAPAVMPPATYTVLGYVHTGFNPTTTPTNEPIVGLEIDIPGQGTVITDQNGQFTLNLSQPTFVTLEYDGLHCRTILGPDAPSVTATLQPGVNQTIQIGAQNGTANELAHGTVYYWVDRMNELMRGILGNAPQLDIASQVQPQVNIPSSCNAYYIGNSINFYRAQGSCNNTASASVTAHEWGHGLDDRYGGISQVDGLSEGWGDICSIYLLDDPIIGHGFYTNGNGIRNGNNTRQFPQGGGVHRQGQTWMGFAWKYRQNLRGTFGTSQAITISNNTVLASVVANAIDQPNAVLQVFLADDDDGNIVNGTPHYTYLENACNSHSLPYPPILPGFLAHDNELGDSLQPLTPRFVECRAIPSFGTFNQVRVHYNDGQARQRAMIPTGAPDTYRALLPGMLSPQTLTYHFEGVHNGGTTFRLPATGEYSYRTLAEETIWFDDFETGGNGWTHGATMGTDDFEIATPTGSTGPWWTDPDQAHSGTLCAGNNLTGGAYPASTASWFRPPAIDCTGYSSVRMRFKRWASCDVGFQDQLSIWVNGQPKYFSPQTPLADNDWVTYELSLPSAANNPAVMVEFRLNTDAQIQAGGWAIDDFEIFTTTTSLPPTTTLTLLPEMAPDSAPLGLTVKTPVSQPFVWVIGNDGGPTLFPGVPPILVGGNPISFFDYTDASGNYTLPIGAPSGVPLLGFVWYSQVVTIDPNFEIVTSNQFINLFTQ
ncbi:MAG: hypothetical protein NXI31_03680 [bacterium]|nr:hypothetical protein [bacterium]